MNTQTFEVKEFPAGTTPEGWVTIPKDEYEGVKAMTFPERKNWMRNVACPCGSGKKFKKCCWNKPYKLTRGEQKSYH